MHGNQHVVLLVDDADATGREIAGLGRWKDKSIAGQQSIGTQNAESSLAGHTCIFQSEDCTGMPYKTLSERFP